MVQKKQDSSQIFFNRGTETFLTTAKTRNFSEAAKILGSSQSAVSQTIRLLEDRLGFPLFHRESRPLNLTREARLLFNKLATASGDISILIDSLRSENFLKPALRLGAMESFANVAATQLCDSLRGVVSQLMIRSATSNILVDEVAAQHLDMAVVSFPLSRGGGTRQIFLYEEPWVLLFPRGYPVRDGPMNWETLKTCGLPEIGHDRSTANGRIMQDVCRSLSLDFPSPYEIDSNHLIFQFVKSGLGWALTQPFGLISHGSALDFCRVLPAPTPITNRRVYLVRRNGVDPELASLVASKITGILRASVIPELARIAPWIAEGFFFADGDPVGRGA